MIVLISGSPIMCLSLTEPCQETQRKSSAFHANIKMCQLQRVGYIFYFTQSLAPNLFRLSIKETWEILLGTVAKTQSNTEERCS